MVLAQRSYLIVIQDDRWFDNCAKKEKEKKLVTFARSIKVERDSLGTRLSFLGKHSKSEYEDTCKSFRGWLRPVTIYLRG